MGKKTENDEIVEKAGFRKPKSFRIAYSLNNYQPVECTIISDQPLFYMEDEIPFEEDSLFCDDLFDEVDPDFLDEELASLRTKMDAYERLSSDYKRDTEEVYLEFLADTSLLSEPAHKIDEKAVLERITEALTKSRMAATLLSFAEKHDVELVCSEQIANVSYDKKAGKILIRPDIDFIDQLLLTIQELRRHWQHRQGVLLHPLTFHPDQAVLVNRAQLADLSVAVIRCAWELKLAGEDQYWQRIENSSMSDLGRALAREALIDFRTLNNGQASGAVFETWFLSERCRQRDKELIQSMLADYRGYVFDNTEASKMISIDLVCALGEQPFGKNYLAPYAHMIMNDPVFTDVRDRSNANFLWFIKFERSFTETEQELQSIPHHKMSGIDQADNNQIEDTEYEDCKEAWSKEHLRHDILGKSAGSDGGNVIHVQFGAQKNSRTGLSS